MATAFKPKSFTPAATQAPEVSRELRNQISQISELSQIQELANALEVRDILNRASELANELVALVKNSDVQKTSLVTGRPTAVSFSLAESARAAEIIQELQMLSELYTERMLSPADAPHPSQHRKYQIQAAEMMKTNPAMAATAVSAFASYRVQFAKMGYSSGKPFDFISAMPVLKDFVNVAKAAIADPLSRRINEKKDLDSEKRRLDGERNIDARARVVEDEANTSGVISQPAAAALAVAIGSGVNAGAVAGTFAEAALQDVQHDKELRARHRAYPTPFDDLRTMQPH